MSGKMILDISEEDICRDSSLYIYSGVCSMEAFGIDWGDTFGIDFNSGDDVWCIMEEEKEELSRGLVAVVWRLVFDGNDSLCLSNEDGIVGEALFDFGDGEDLPIIGLAGCVIIVGVKGSVCKVIFVVDILDDVLSAWW